MIVVYVLVINRPLYTLNLRMTIIQIYVATSVVKNKNHKLIK